MAETPLHLRDCIPVVCDGIELEVHGHVNVEVNHHIQSGSHETYVETIGTGDSGISKPEAVTAELAETLHDEFGISIEDHGIQAIDVHSDEIDVL